jgi:GAF domain-containing protein
MVAYSGAPQAGVYANFILMVSGHACLFRQLWRPKFQASDKTKDFYLCGMAEDLLINKGTKEEQYVSLIPQLKGLVEGEEDVVANMANIAAALKEQFAWLWVGFYIVKKEELVLGPFQGPVACTRIKKGRGVCGTSWAEARTLVVDDVEKFPGHIACSSLSRSEIVIPIIKNGTVWGVLDADSETIAHYDETDKKYLEAIVGMIDTGDLG